MSLKKSIGKLLLKMGRWTPVGEIPSDTNKCVIIEAPHTSIHDFFVGMAYFWYIERPVNIMMKAEFFKTPIMSHMLKKMGAIPVNRGHRNHMVEKMCEEFGNRDEMTLVICPEATRKKTDRWKKGFYLIAQEARVPVALGFIDYKKRICGVGKMMTPTGDYDKDLAEIWDFYKDIKAKHPENFNLDEQYRTQEH
mgnify:CR=1 FL=1